MEFRPQDPEYETRVRDSFARQPAMVLVGATMTRVVPGLCEIELPWRAEITQQHGFVHGGLVAAIGDSAAGYAAFTLFPTDASVLTVEYKVNLLAPADGERLVATARVVRSGRQLTVCRSDIATWRNGEPRLCATMLVTLMAMHGRADAGAQSHIPEETTA